MLSLVRLYADIALLRRGPEELPASLFLLLGTVVANFLVNFIVSTLLPPFPGPWHLHLAVDILFTLAWYAVLMRLFARPERFLYFGGFDLWRGGGSTHTGLLIAPKGLDQDGFLVKLLAGQGSYLYRLGATNIRGTYILGSVMAGWRRYGMP